MIATPREELPIHTDLAIARVRANLAETKDSDALGAAIALLDHIGVGPHSVQEVGISTSVAEQRAAELDAVESDADSESLPPARYRLPDPVALALAPPSGATGLALSLVGVVFRDRGAYLTCRRQALEV